MCVKYSLLSTGTLLYKKRELKHLLWESIQILRSRFYESRWGISYQEVFQSVNTRERPIYFISDVPHLIKTTRNCFSTEIQLHSDMPVTYLVNAIALTPLTIWALSLHLQFGLYQILMILIF